MKNRQVIPFEIDARRRLTKEQIAQIKILRLRGIKQKHVAQMFNISPSLVRYHTDKKYAEKERRECARRRRESKVPTEIRNKIWRECAQRRRERYKSLGLKEITTSEKKRKLAAEQRRRERYAKKHGVGNC